jgi:hypothetical protein
MASRLSVALAGLDDAARLQTLATVAAYRERYGVTTSDPTGPAPDMPNQRADLDRVLAAMQNEHDKHARTPRRRTVGTGPRGPAL